MDEWADTYRRLSPEASAEPGQWRTSRAEYQRGIFRAMSDPAVHTVVVMSSAQVGKTEIVNNTIGYYIHQDPAPMLLVNPTLEMAQAWSKDRCAPMLRDTPALHGLVSDAGSKKTGNTMLHKTFPGGHLSATGANSAAGLAARPVRVLLCDEVDRYPVSAGTEGDPVSLAKKRTRTFWNRKILLTSTPTVKGASRIEAEFLESDQRYFLVPCHECGHKQRLKWSNVIWPEGRPQDAFYACEGCGSEWSDAQRLANIPNGEWQATEEFNGRAGFHLNEIYSPWSTMGDMALAFLEAKKSSDTLQTFVNTSLGETWEVDEGERLEWEQLHQRREVMPAVPDWVTGLFGGIDTQNDRYEGRVWGYGHGEEAVLIDRWLLYGQPDGQELLRQVEQHIRKQYTRDDGVVMGVTRWCWDSGGHYTDEVYTASRRLGVQWVIPIKGSSQYGNPIADFPRKRNKKGVYLTMVGTDNAKELIYSRLRIQPEPGKRVPGCIHLPARDSICDDEELKQLCAERKIPAMRHGQRVYRWEARGRRNEALDCAVYALAALRISQQRFGFRLEQSVSSESKPQQQQKPKRKSQASQASGGWLNPGGEGTWL